MPNLRNWDRHLHWALGAAALLGVAGCYSLPSFQEAPGTIYYQRSRAVVHDPFPDNSIGPPVVGGRPAGFEKPLADPIKSQLVPKQNLFKSN